MRKLRSAFHPRQATKKGTGGRVAFHAARKMVNIFEEKAELSSKGLA